MARRRIVLANNRFKYLAIVIILLITASVMVIVLMNANHQIAGELTTATNYSFKINDTMLISSFAAQCSLQLVAPCNNNEPSQFVCVNLQYASNMEVQYQSIYPNRSICPAFQVEGKLSCGITYNHCVVTQTALPS